MKILIRRDKHMSKKTKKISVWVLILLLISVFAFVMLKIANNKDFTVSEIEKYGNVKLSISGSEFLEKGYDYGDVVTVSIADKKYEMPVCSNYSDVEEGKMVCAVKIDEVDKDDKVVLAINMGDFATNTGIATKNEIPEEPGYSWEYNETLKQPIKVSIELKEKGAYYEEYLVRQVEVSDEILENRNLSNEELANFREINTTGMGNGILYRSSSPINPEVLGDNVQADKSVKDANVKNILNLEDTMDGMKNYSGWPGSYYSSCNILPLNLGMDFMQKDFQLGLAEGMRFIISNNSPYLIHCTEGKGRTGFVCALLECFMGATKDEIVNDYMQTYYNFYGIEADSEQYRILSESNILKSLARAFGIDEIDDKTDLKTEAVNYMTEKMELNLQEIEQLRIRLSRDTLA